MDFPESADLPFLNTKLPCCGRHARVLAPKRILGSEIDVSCPCKGIDKRWSGTVAVSYDKTFLRIFWTAV
jgi:hypothetical protein